MIYNPSRIYVRKNETGAIWSSSSLSCGVWRKDDLGLGLNNNTCRVGYVTTQFNPFNRRNSRRFTLLSV